MHWSIGFEENTAFIYLSASHIAPTNYLFNLRIPTIEQRQKLSESPAKPIKS